MVKSGFGEEPAKSTKLSKRSQDNDRVAANERSLLVDPSRLFVAAEHDRCAAPSLLVGQ